MLTLGLATAVLAAGGALTCHVAGRVADAPLVVVDFWTDAPLVGRLGPERSYSQRAGITLDQCRTLVTAHETAVAVLERELGMTAQRASELVRARVQLEYPVTADQVDRILADCIRRIDNQ